LRLFLIRIKDILRFFIPYRLIIFAGYWSSSLRVNAEEKKGIHYFATIHSNII